MKTKTIDMTSGEPFKLIVLFSIPILIGNIFQQLYNFCDTFIVGRLLGPNALAAIGTTGPMNFLIFGFLWGMTSGFSVITSQRFGAHDTVGLKKSIAANILLNFISGIVITIIACLLTKPILISINTPDEIFKDSFNYIFIIYLGIMATILYNGCACILRAVGDSKTPLYFLIIATIINIILDIVFITSLKMGVVGAAVATVLAQIIAGLASIFWIYLKFPQLRISKSDFKLEWRFIWKHLSIGMNMGFQFSITAIGVVILQGALNVFGSTTIAAFTAAQKVEQLITIVAGVMGVTVATYAGQNLGAGKISRIKEGVAKSILISVSFAIFAALLAWFFGDEMTAFFLDKNSVSPEQWEEILKASQTYLKICGIFFPILFILFIYRNALQGIGRGFWPLMGGVFELIARTISAYTLPGLMGYAGICIAGPIAWAAAIPLGIAYYIIISKYKDS